MIYLGTMVVVCWENALIGARIFSIHIPIQIRANTQKHTHVEYTVNIIRRSQTILFIYSSEDGDDDDDDDDDVDDNLKMSFTAYSTLYIF